MGELVGESLRNATGQGKRYPTGHVVGSDGRNGGHPRRAPGGIGISTNCPHRRQGFPIRCAASFASANPCQSIALMSRAQSKFPLQSFRRLIPVSIDGRIQRMCPLLATKKKYPTHQLRLAGLSYVRSMSPKIRRFPTRVWIATPSSLFRCKGKG